MRFFRALSGNMGWSEAVAYVNAVGPFVSVLFVAIPIVAMGALLYLRSAAPTASRFFPKLIAWCWLALFGFLVLYMLSRGIIYGESGPPPATVAMQTAIELWGLIAIHGALVVSTIWAVYRGKRAA
jgi:hypothetical protein